MKHDIFLFYFYLSATHLKKKCLFTAKKICYQRYFNAILGSLQDKGFFGIYRIYYRHRDFIGIYGIFKDFLGVLMDFQETK